MAKKLFGMLVLVLASALIVVGCELLPEDDPPRVVTGVIATFMPGTTPRGDSIHITWNTVQGATRYELAYRTEMDSLDTRIGINSWLTITTFTHTGFIRNRGSLTYYVRAHGTRTDSDGRTVPWVGPWARSGIVDVHE